MLLALMLPLNGKGQDRKADTARSILDRVSGSFRPRADLLHDFPASFPFRPECSIGAGHQTSFLVKGTGTQYITALLPKQKGGWGLGLSSFGYHLWQERKFWFGYGLQLSDGFAAGLRFDYERYGPGRGPEKKQHLIIAGGVSVRPTPTLFIGSTIENPQGQIPLEKNGTDPKVAPLRFRIRVRREVSDKSALKLTFHKTLGTPVSIRTSGALRITPGLGVRAGLNTTHLSPAFGLWYRWKSLELNLGSSVHPRLGVTPHSTLTYHFDRNSP